MNTPDGSIVDFYESNYYDINLFDLGEDIISQADAHSEYNITNFIAREALITILEQRFVPRLVIARQAGDSELVCLDRITITNTKNNEQFYIAEGEYGLPKNQIHFRVRYDNNNTYLDCYRAQSGKDEGFIDLILSSDVLIETNTLTAQSFDLSSIVRQKVIQELASGGSNKPRVRVSYGSLGIVAVVPLETERDIDKDEGVAAEYSGLQVGLFKDALAIFTLTAYWNETDKYELILQVAPFTQGGERPIEMDLSGFESEENIKLIYADGGFMDIKVTFDIQGNPIRFSNGENVFEIVWPEETAE